MIRILAIAGLAVRAAVRSRLVLVLIAMLTLSLVALPAAIKGDGTPAGRLRILLEYSLGFTGLILGAATLWTGCGAISQEIESGQIQLAAVKPVSRFDLWLGKWLGLLGLNAFLLALAGGATYACVRWNARDSGADQVEPRRVREEQLVARRLVAARAEPLAAEARERLDALRRAGAVPPGVSDALALRLLQDRLAAERSAVSPGTVRQWVFDPPRGGWPASRPDARGAVRLRTRFSSGFSMEKSAVRGEWSVGAAGDTNAFAFRMEQALDGRHQFLIPAAALPPGRPVMIQFANGSRDQSNTVVFDREAGVELLLPGGSFAANLARSLLILWCQLALLAAIGLTAGSLFSFPVATFVAAALLLMVTAGHCFASGSGSRDLDPHQHHDEGAPTVLQKAGASMGRVVDRLAAPVAQLDPLPLLADGIEVPWSLAGKAVGLLVLLYPAILWAAGGWLLTRRELALPD